MMSFEGTVHNAATGVELEFREEAGLAVFVVDALIVPEEDGTLVVQKNELGHGNDNGKTGFAGNKFIKTNHICISISIFKNIPVGAKEAGITATICHNNGFLRSKMGGKGMDTARIHIYMNSVVCRETGCRDSHTKEAGSIMSGLVTA